MTAQPFPLIAQPVMMKQQVLVNVANFFYYYFFVSHCLKNRCFNYVCFNASNPKIVMKLRNTLIWLDCSYEVCKIILKALRGSESLYGVRLLAGLYEHRYGPHTTVYWPSTGLNSYEARVWK